MPHTQQGQSAMLRFNIILDESADCEFWLTAPRLCGKSGHYINYRHIIDWLVRKPDAFSQYRFREDLFPSLTFRRAYDRLREHCSEGTADMEYLRILQHAARNMESTVEEALDTLQERGVTPRWNTVLDFCPSPRISIPEIKVPTVCLASYDALLQGRASS